MRRDLRMTEGGLLCSIGPDNYPGSLNFSHSSSPSNPSELCIGSLAIHLLPSFWRDSLLLHRTVLVLKGACLFFHSAFNAIQPEGRNFGSGDCHLAAWTIVYLINRPQYVRLSRLDLLFCMTWGSQKERQVLEAGKKVSNSTGQGFSRGWAKLPTLQPMMCNDVTLLSGFSSW